MLKYTLHIRRRNSFFGRVATSDDRPPVTRQGFFTLSREALTGKGVAEWREHWLALAGWQSGAFKCAPRDRWLGWHPSVQFRRLHLIGNNTRFLILPEAKGIKNLASRTLGLSLRRLSGDWREAHGHVLELAETLVDPSLFEGTCYRA